MLNYWEVFKYAKDKEVYKMVSPIPRMDGKHVIMKATDHGIVMKELGSYHDDSAETLVVAYGGVTGAKFDKVEEYVEINYREFLDTPIRTKVYTKSPLEGRFVIFNRYTDFQRCGINDMADLIKAKFYIKNTLQN